MLAMLPLYLLDTLLSVWLSEMTTFQIQAFCIAGIVFALDLAGLLPRVFTSVFHHLTLFGMLPTALGLCLIAAGLAAVTVWSLDRQDF
jgi:hypothetical protein